MASNNVSALVGADGHAITNTSSNTTSPLTFSEQLSGLPQFLLENWDLFVLEFRIVFTALACIYIGAHGALRRPPSAVPAKSKKHGAKGNHHDEEEDLVEGLKPSDAILFPILAGVVLIGLYKLIKWLEDPDIINKILGAYFSVMSLASLGKLLADTLHMVTGFIFPNVWRAKDGTLYHIDAEKKGQFRSSPGSDERVLDGTRNTPFPGYWSKSGGSARKTDLYWELRRLFTEHWTIRFSIHGLFNENLRIKLNDMFGVVLAFGATVIYYTTKSVLLSNIMGYAFSYAGIIMMSPTTFTTGSAVLFGLFFYDIYMVFYTPYMVTVATKLDVPIKLVFQGPKKASMLGLGDIVIPGMFIGLCLRFDHYLYYHRQRKLVPVELETETKVAGQLAVSTETQRMVVKPEYINPQGQWGDRWWSTKLTGILSPSATPSLKASAFHKTYFYAAMAGYLLAMVVTLAMLLVFNHAQPALLYLVPGVVFSVWLTGLVRGEVHDMWVYTEDGSLDGSDTIVEVDEDGNVTKEIKKDEQKTDGESKDDAKAIEGTKTNDVSEAKGKEAVSSKSTTKAVEHCVFNFSILAPASSEAA
ncbi:signal peptide peptidase-domain-containing protein [Microdochium trichocladiopsis]|uniref:Signal peptide peptidase-domain-containing protein n=1 Tax=Microdochium trichocladiopsis TaxID=1682393 RepID=A0A9P9BUC3_9PEZI|nr:signal peptide peptidase-domain-containing protein [Microdochium trichocladiopsis]KAH7037319.1 signal peptide peptidase-domain-containing protein [Microdochium trichocladiopsis]